MPARLAVVGLVVGLTIVLIIADSGGSRHGRPPPPATVPTVPPTVVVGPEEFGANVNRLFNDGTYSQTEIDAQLSALHATGATVARSDALWEATEPAPPVAGQHHYDWSFDDKIAGSLAAHGLRWLPIVDYSAPWAQSLPGDDHSPPSSTADYAAYAGALAARYGPGGSFWRTHPTLPAMPVEQYEIWNEPDNPVFWSRAPDPSRYDQLYAGALRAIGSIDPNARVLVGGLTAPRTFLPAMLAADPGLRGEIEGVAIHPYGRVPSAVLANVATARHALSSLGLGTVPLYVTEFGWTTQPPGALDGAPASARPGYIRDTLAALGASDCDVAASLLYTWVTPEHNPRDAQDWFGVSPPGAGGSPDVSAFAAGIRAGGAAARGPSC
jgi:hypothetical protein